MAALISRDWLTPGDGLLTFDTVSGREWLDLTQTQLASFPGATLQERLDAVIAETQPGGSFAGFTQATAADVTALAQSGGINTSTLDFSINGSAAATFVNLLGDTSPGVVVTSNTTSYGLLLSPPGSLIPIEVLYVPAGRSSPGAGLQATTLVGANAGVWLYQQVPEPSTVILLGLVWCTGISAWR